MQYFLLDRARREPIPSYLPALKEEPHCLNKPVFSIEDMEAIDKGLADLLKQKQESTLHALAHHDSLNH